MNETVSGEYYKSRIGDMLDSICHRHYQGRKRATEEVLLKNPGLAKLGVVIPEGTVIFLPVLDTAIDEGVINLWD